MNVKMQRQIVARIYGVGEDRVWIDPTKLSEVKGEITREGLRKLVEKGTIKILPIKGQTHREHDRPHTPGNKKGKKSARVNVTWKERIRAQRKMLKKLKKEGKIDNETFKEFYYKAKAGMFRSVSHMMAFLQERIKK
jgi:large subunit ribosomal protein L19e